MMARSGEGARGTPMDGATAPLFAELLRAHRVRAGLTQEELAERSGLTAAAVSQLERGVRRRPQPRTVRALADALGLDDGERAALTALAHRPGRARTTPSCAPTAPSAPRGMKRSPASVRT